MFQTDAYHSAVPLRVYRVQFVPRGLIESRRCLHGQLEIRTRETSATASIANAALPSPGLTCWPISLSKKMAFWQGFSPKARNPWQRARRRRITCPNLVYRNVARRAQTAGVAGGTAESLPEITGQRTGFFLIIIIRRLEMPTSAKPRAGRKNAPM